MDSELGAVVDLMAWSAIHRSWTVSDIERLVVPPIRLQQRAYIVDRGCIVAWGSWAWLSKEAEHGFVDGTRKLQPNDWSSGQRLWLVDALAPVGHARELISMIRKKLRNQDKKNNYMHFRRNTHGRIRYSKVLL